MKKLLVISCLAIALYSCRKLDQPITREFTETAYWRDAKDAQDALAACKDAIDELKERVPLWKKEVYSDGEEWIGRGS